jgi:signal recognition particle subunit SRP54
MTLIEKAEKEMDQEQAQEAAEKMARAEFTLEDFLEQMRQVRKLGPIQDLLAMLPGVPGAKQQLKDVQVDEGEMARTEAIICSMTREERRNPSIIGGSRRLRIARGSGTTTAEVNGLIKQFTQARKMMKTMMGMAGFGGRGLKGPKGLKLPKLPPGIGSPGT